LSLITIFFIVNQQVLPAIIVTIDSFSFFIFSINYLVKCRKKSRNWWDKVIFYF